MVSRVRTVAFQGIEAVPVDVQVMVGPGKIGMQIVGLPDKAVAESRERVQAALHASGLSMPPKKVTVNLAPADLPKEGSHYDLPIALGLMATLWPTMSCWASSISTAPSPPSPARCPPRWARTRSARG
jgi:magnesium chelatase family protein